MGGSLFLPFLFLDSFWSYRPDLTTSWQMSCWRLGERLVAAQPQGAELASPSASRNCSSHPRQSPTEVCSRASENMTSLRDKQNTRQDGMLSVSLHMARDVDKHICNKAWTLELAAVNMTIQIFLTDCYRVSISHGLLQWP